MADKIRELIVVEGHHDTQRLKQFFDCDTIETGGDNVSRKVLDYIAQAQKTRGVIVFTDPDRPGEHIRSVIARKVPGVRHAFIDKSKARTEKKVGVEHAAREDLEEALRHTVSFMKEGSSISHSDFVDLGLVGDAALRHAVCLSFHIGPCNGKTCFKRLNQMGITADQIQELYEKESFRKLVATMRNS